MTDHQVTALYTRAWHVFGAADRKNKCVEELTELSLALQHHAQGKASDSEVISEIADVLITVEQLAQYFGAARVATAKQLKLARFDRLVDEAGRDREVA